MKIRAQSILGRLTCPAPALWLGLLAAVVLALLPVHGARGQDLPAALPAAGDGQDFWVLVPAADLSKFQILHHAAGDPPQVIRPANLLYGRLANGGVSAGPGKLWMVFANLNVQSLTAVPSQPPGRIFYEGGVEPTLPRGSQLQAVGGDRYSLWAVVRISQREQLSQIDAPPPAAPSINRRGLGDEFGPSRRRLEQRGRSAASTQPATASAPATEPATTTVPATATAPAESQSLPADRLLRLAANRWVKVALPPDWGLPQRCWLIVPPGGRGAPLLIAYRGGAGGDSTLQIYRSFGDGQDGATPVVNAAPTWYPWPDAQLSPIYLEDQLVLGRALPSAAGGLDVELSAVRLQGISRIGAFHLEKAPAAWALVPASSSACLVTNDEAGLLQWSQMDLRGQIMGKAVPLVARDVNQWADSFNWLFVVAALALATLIMFGFWQRDPQVNRLALPPNFVVAGLPSRIIAALLDLAPTVAVAMLLFGVDLAHTRYYWPGFSQSVKGMVPGLVAIALFVTHTMLSELFTARTLGKMIMGLQVMGLQGQPPHLWQVITRNLMKALELIGWPLLIMPLVGPQRQRLGDLVARTVVVTNAPPEPPQDNFPFDE